MSRLGFVVWPLFPKEARGLYIYVYEKQHVLRAHRPRTEDARPRIDLHARGLELLVDLF
jgi:hypothetical protein